MTTVGIIFQINFDITVCYIHCFFIHQKKCSLIFKWYLVVAEYMYFKSIVLRLFITQILVKSIPLAQNL